MENCSHYSDGLDRNQSFLMIILASSPADLSNFECIESAFE